MGLLEAILEGSSIIQEIKNEAREEGRAEGRAESRAEELVEWRRVLHTALKAKFPELELMSEIDTVASLEILRSLLELTFVSADRSEVQRVICSAVPEN